MMKINVEVTRKNAYDLCIIVLGFGWTCRLCGSESMHRDQRYWGGVAYAILTDGWDGTVDIEVTKDNAWYLSSLVLCPGWATYMCGLGRWLSDDVGWSNYVKYIKGIACEILEGSVDEND